MIVYFVLACVIALAVFILVAARQPDEFRITRTGRFAAPASAIFPHINSLHNWQAWSPWAKLDPHAQNSFSGPEEGSGAHMAWSGNSKVGAGSMTITESRPHELICLRLDFLKPFKATNTAEFTLSPENGHTLVTWRMNGTNKLLGKIMGLLMNCEKMVGSQFEQGLAALKSIVEHPPG